MELLNKLKKGKEKLNKDELTAARRLMGGKSLILDKLKDTDKKISSSKKENN